MLQDMGFAALKTKRDPYARTRERARSVGRTSEEIILTREQ